MIVDSTRKGKRFPDSMSKTIPIWTCVLNRAIRKHLSKTNDVSLLNEGVSLVLLLIAVLLIVYEHNRREKFLNHNFYFIFYCDSSLKLRIKKVCYNQKSKFDIFFFFFTFLQYYR